MCAARPCIRAAGMVPVCESGATRMPLFSTLRRGVEFISRPNALDSHERHRRRSIASIILTLFLEAHPFSRSPTITGAGSLLLTLDLDSPFSFRDIEKHPYTSRRRRTYYDANSRSRKSIAAGILGNLRWILPEKWLEHSRNSRKEREIGQN